MRRKLEQFMQGRYGMDQFGRALFWATMICLILSLFFRGSFLYILGIVLIVYSYFRMFSRNYAKRYAENQQYLQLTQGIRRKFATFKRDMAQRKTHHIYHCPNCKQKIRVPRGKGQIIVTCPKCHTEFVKRS